MEKDVPWKRLSQILFPQDSVRRDRRPRPSQIPPDRVCPRCNVKKLSDSQWLKYRGICRSCGKKRRVIALVDPWKIRQLRKDLGFTQVEASRRCRWSQTLQSLYETGKERMNLKRFAEYERRLKNESH